ncbi:MAG: hypothetical protein KME31_21940 [Tolypothrix carrinoi HA7290-LM1]|nr:hypothetical protein [Tolypothrix carrinoi HA7290-LM1]
MPNDGRCVTVGRAFPTHCLPNAQCPMPNAQCPMPNNQPLTPLQSLINLI